MESFYRPTPSRPTSACISDLNSQRPPPSRNFRSRTSDLRSRLAPSEPARASTTNVMPSSEPFPYPDPLPSWFSGTSSLSVLRGPPDNPEVGFVKRITRLARLESDTKRQEGRRASSAVSRQSSAKRRPSDRPPTPLRRYSAASAPPPVRPDSVSTRRRSAVVPRPRLTVASCEAMTLDENDAPRTFSSRPLAASAASAISYGRLLARRTLAQCPAPESSMLIRLDSSPPEAKPQLRYVAGTRRQNAAVLGSGFRAFASSTTRVNF